MTDSSKPARKTKARASKASTKKVDSVPADDTATQEAFKLPQDPAGDVYLPQGYDYSEFPESPLPGEQHTPYPGAWTYTWDSEKRAWMCYERGYKGPQGDQGIQGQIGPRGDVASVVECATPPTNATRGVFYLTSTNVLLIGI